MLASQKRPILFRDRVGARSEACSIAGKVDTESALASGFFQLTTKSDFGGAQVAADHSLNDILWMLICAALVMLMQGGFCCLETGLVRSKNSINVAIKNVIDFCVSAVIFWVFGFGLMFGASYGGFIGTSHFLMGREAGPWLLGFFLFQMVFCGTATTIISGAVGHHGTYGETIPLYRTSQILIRNSAQPD